MADKKPEKSSSLNYSIYLAVVIALIAILASCGYLSSASIFIESLVYGRNDLTTSKTDNLKLFTKAELAKYSGEDGGKVYLGLLGDVYDVTKGAKHYGVGGGYHFFSGKDGTRAFVSGDFTDSGLIEDTTALSLQDILGLEDWRKFYNKDYTHIGRLVGLYYNEDGKPTQAYRDYQVEVKKALLSKESDEDDRLRFPPCNFEYKQDQGRRIWCSTLSGGVQRDWTGVPRQYFRAGKQEPRCACLKDFGAPSGEPEIEEGPNRGDLDNPSMKLYEDCDPMSFQCFFKE